jgi:hypothetical protein
VALRVHPFPSECNIMEVGAQFSNKNKEKLTSQQPRGSPLAASNPADIIVISGANFAAAHILRNSKYAV